MYIVSALHSFGNY